MTCRLLDTMEIGKLVQTVDPVGLPWMVVSAERAVTPDIYIATQCPVSSGARHNTVHTVHCSQAILDAITPAASSI